MDRQIPDVWNIFSIGGSPDYYRNQQHHLPNVHVNWSTKNQDLLHKWCDRSSPCDRPRTYDKFYNKLPGNFIDPAAKSRGHGAKSLCSSEVDEVDEVDASSGGRKKKRRKKSERNYSKTITERDVRHLDRHLSMKKTIRKKIMRDLQQAFVVQDDKQSDSNLENLNRLNFDPKKKAVNDAKLLDLLKCEDRDSGHGTDPGQSPSQSSDRASKVVRDRNVPQRCLVSDSSSCGGYDSAESEKDMILATADQIQSLDIQDVQIIQPAAKKKKSSFWNQLFSKKS